MPRNLDELIAHGDELAGLFERTGPDAFREPSTRSLLAHAAMRRAAAERDLRSAVVAAKRDGMAWDEVGSILGVSGEAARKRYRAALGEGTDEAAAVLREASGIDQADETRLVVQAADRDHPEETAARLLAHLGQGERAAVLDLVAALQAATTRNIARELGVEFPKDTPSVA